MNKHFKLPKVFLLGYTTLNLKGLIEYLQYTNQEEFLKEIGDAQKDGLSDGEILCSFYAKACYASLTTKKNKNISKVRGIKDNIIGVLDSEHGSVLEHANINFMVTDCSRIFTHEMIRHRPGAAYSQTSGRYVRNDELNLVVDPILTPIYNDVEEVRTYLEVWYKHMEEKLNLNNVSDFKIKKKLTSALRRLLPNGQSNEIGMTLNIRALRHTIEMRTSEHAEWEIRLIFNQVYDIMKQHYPIMFIDAKEEMVDGQRQIKFKNKKI